MREEPLAEADAGSEREDSRQSQKYRVALVLYAVLAGLSWFTLDARISIGGSLVELRLIPLLIIGGLTLRTVLMMRAERIRRTRRQPGTGLES